MKIRDIIKESSPRTDAPKVGNEKAVISRSAKDAEVQFNTAQVGAISDFDPKEARKKVRDMYGMEFVDDFVDNIELPNSIHDTDKQMSMMSKDNRK